MLINVFRSQPIEIKEDKIPPHWKIRKLESEEGKFIFTIANSRELDELIDYLADQEGKG